MKRLMLIASISASLLSFAFAQQSVAVSGLVQTEGELPDGARVGVHVINLEGAWGEEVVTTTPEAGNFDVTLDETVAADALAPLGGGVVPLPGLQSDYSISPEGVNFTRAQTNVYIDENGNGTFDREVDTPYLGVVNLEEPSGFFVVLYVDADATLSAQEQTLNLSEGWNVFTVRFSETGEASYEVVSEVNDAVLDVFSPTQDN